MGIEIGLATLIGGLVSAGTSAVTSWRSMVKQDEMQKKALKSADEAANKANQKKANPFALLADAQRAGQQSSATLLTGPDGNSGLTLGTSSLLGA